MIHLIILLDTIQKDRRKFREWGSKKTTWTGISNPFEYLRQSFFAKKFTAKSFIVDIGPGSKYPSDERNKLFSLKKKTNLKYYFRYFHVLYRIASLEKSEKFDLLPDYFI